MLQANRITLLGDIVVPQNFKTISYPISGAVICNFEAPLLGEEISPRPKAGPALRSYGIPAELKNGIFCISNNHIMDFGTKGLYATEEACLRFGIKLVGAGNDLREAESPLIFNINDVRIGLIARCETQFGAASENRPGVATINSKIYELIRKLKTEVDMVIVSVHGGAEMCPWPSPTWQDQLRSWADAGAAIVHGHHSHIPQGFELYKDSLIFYGLGNFLVNPVEWIEQPNSLWSIAPEVQVSKSGIEKWEIHTSVVESNAGIFVRESCPEESALHQQYLAKINRPLADRVLLTGLWQEAAVRMYFLWNAIWLRFEIGKSPKQIAGLFRNVSMATARRLFCNFKKRVPSASRDELLIWYHLFACESHRDAIATALGVLSGEIDDLRSKDTKRLADEFMPWSLGI